MKEIQEIYFKAIKVWRLSIIAFLEESISFHQQMLWIK